MADNTEPRPDDPVDEGDDALLAHLRDLAAAADPVPEEVTLAARSAIAWLNLDAEIAQLTIDSDTEDKELSGVRSVGTLASRQVSFESGEYVIDMEVNREDDLIKIIGQCSPAQVVQVTLHTLEASHELTTDDLGRFRAELPGSRLRVEVRWPGAERPIITEWLTV
jgi:hypothetical protein